MSSCVCFNVASFILDNFFKRPCCRSRKVKTSGVHVLFVIVKFCDNACSPDRNWEYWECTFFLPFFSHRRARYIKIYLHVLFTKLLHPHGYWHLQALLGNFSYHKHHIINSINSVGSMCGSNSSHWWSVCLFWRRHVSAHIFLLNTYNMYRLKVSQNYQYNFENEVAACDRIFEVAVCDSVVRAMMQAQVTWWSKWRSKVPRTVHTSLQSGRYVPTSVSVSMSPTYWLRHPGNCVFVL